MNWRKNDRSWTDQNAAGRTTNNTTATGNQRQSTRTPEVREVGLDPSKPALKRRRADPDKPKEIQMRIMIQRKTEVIQSLGQLQKKKQQPKLTS